MPASMNYSARKGVNWWAVLLFALALGLGVFCAQLMEIFGGKAALMSAGLLACALLVPTLRKETVRRIRGLRQQFRWWHSLWLLVFLSALVFRLRDTQAISDSAVDFWALYRIGLMGTTALVLTTLVTLKRLPFSTALFRGLLGRLLIYALICVCSTCWSAYRVWTLYKSLEYLIVVVLLAAILAAFPSVVDCKRLFDFTWALDGLLLVSICIGALVWPADAFQPSGGLISVQLQGVLPLIADNGVGHISAILSVVALSRMLGKERRRNSHIFYMVVFAVAVTTMILAQARSAILAFLFGVLVLLFFSRRIGWLACGALAVVLLFVATGAGRVFHEYMRRGQDADSVATLSGRTDWWEFGLSEFAKSPWVGMGAFTARFTVLSKFGDQEVSTVHNTYLEAALGVGFTGLIAILWTFLGVWRELIRELTHPRGNPVRRQLALEAVAVLGVITIRSFFTVGLIVHYDLDFLAVLGFAELARRLPEKAVAPAKMRSRLTPQHESWLPGALGLPGGTTRTR